MKFKRGVAPAIRNIACMIPSMLPKANAEEADGICLRPCGSLFAILKLLSNGFDFDLKSMFPGSERKKYQRTKPSRHQKIYHSS